MQRSIFAIAILAISDLAISGLAISGLVVPDLVISDLVISGLAIFGDFRFGDFGLSYRRAKLRITGSCAIASEMGARTIPVPRAHCPHRRNFRLVANRLCTARCELPPKWTGLIINALRRKHQASAIGRVTVAMFAI